MIGANSSPWSAARFAAGAGSLLVPGVVLKGGNIAPKPAHVASGHTYRSLWSEWDWAGWIKPQVDALASIGGNAVRLIGDLEGVNDGTLTQATYDSHWGQLADYCTTSGLYLYPALGGVSQISAGALTVAQIRDALVAAATYLHTKQPTVCGLDLIQESVRRQVQDSWALSYASTFTPAVRAVTDLSLTYSNSDAGREGEARFIYPLWREVLAQYVDHWDIHVYCPMAPTLVTDAFWGRGEGKPVVIGEFGYYASAGAAEQDRRYDAAVAGANHRPHGVRTAGAFAWAIFDQGTGADAFGMFDTDGTPRLHLTSRFQALPAT